jgi:serine/threonine-protein kinase
MSANAEDLVGKVVGPCLIEAVIGGGGMGVVYRAKHTRLERAVAIKILQPSISRSSAAADSMLQEARVVARLDDPRVVQVYDVGRQDSLSFIVMQLIKGETLADRVQRQGKLSQEEALAIMKEVLRGLSAAHKAGVVHRDLKPSNIMIDDSGAVKLMDFGIAAATGKEEFAPDAAVSGSFDFMAPEQAFGAKPDPRMDLYSFGATYFFALSGRGPFVGTNAMEVLIKHRDSPAPDVRQYVREATPGIAQLLMQLMQKFPESRPASALEVLKSLEGPGIIIAVDASGSPFKILPPPVEEATGLSAEMRGLGLARAPATPAGGRGTGLPPPPPSIDCFSGKVPPATWATMTAMLVVFTGASWTAVGHADWLAAGAAAIIGAGLLAWSGAAGIWPRLAGPLLFAAACGCFFQFGARPGETFPPPVPGIEVAVVSVLGFVVAAVGLFLGFIERQPERGLAAGLLGGAGAILMVAATARSLPDSIGWLDGIPQLFSAAFESLAQSGGFWRWAGLAVFCALFRLAKASEFDQSSWCRRKTVDGVIINWNK